MEVPMPCTRRAASARVALFLGMATGLLAATTTASLAIEILAQPDPLNTSWLSVPDTTRTRLRSGFDFKDGNIDSGNLLRVEPAGSSFESAGAAWVLFDPSGPGVVTSIWFTGKSRQGLDDVLQAVELVSMFDGSRTADETAGKPHPRMLLELMSEFGVKPERTLMIGDTTHDLQMALNAGCQSVGVSYGAHEPDAFHALKPRFIAHTVRELHDWLLNNA